MLALACWCQLVLAGQAATTPLRWGVDLEGGAPYAFTDPHNPQRVIGFEQEIADELAKRLGRPLERVQINWDSLIPALSRGTFDLAMAGIELTDEHRRGALFSRPYCAYQQQIVVRRDNDAIKAFSDLKGKRVGTIANSAAHRMLQGLGDVDCKIYSDIYAAYQDLGFDRLDAVFMDQPIAAYYAKDNPRVRFIQPPLGEGMYAIAFKQGNTALKAQVDDALEAMIRDGSLERILRHWDLWGPQQAKLASYVDPHPVAGGNEAPWQRVLPVLLTGAVMTIKISLLAMALSMGVGLLLAIGRIYGPWPVRAIAQGYVEVFRGTPLLIQLYLLYYGLPNLGIRLDAFVAGVVGLGLNYAANEAENYRAGILAVPRGQTEASLALGLSRLQVLKDVILPQSLRVALPPVTNDFIALFKDSSLVSVITLVELTKAYGMLASATFDYIGLGLVTAALYLAISYPTAMLARWTERRLAKA